MATLSRLLLLSWLLFICGPAFSRPSFTDKYDAEIRSSVHKYWRADFDEWLAWKAQLYQESKLDPAAVSPVGARGLAQIMPGTWGDLARQLSFDPHTRSPHDADFAIDAGAYYMARLRQTWRRDRTGAERNPLAQASYNAGTGNILKAQARCNDARMWPEIAPCLEAVTGPKFSHETRSYVERIAKWRLMMEFE